MKTQIKKHSRKIFNISGIGLEAEFSRQGYKQNSRESYSSEPDTMDNPYMVCSDCSIHGSRPGELKIRWEDTSLRTRYVSHIESGFAFARKNTLLRTGSSCGQHVHVFFDSMKDAKRAYRRLCYCLYNNSPQNSENFPIKSWVMRQIRTIAKRDTNEYCTPIINKELIASRIEGETHGYSHYLGISLTGKKSVEFRFFAGTTNYQEAALRAMLCESLVLGIAHRDYTACQRFDKHILRWIWPVIKSKKPDIIIGMLKLIYPSIVKESQKRLVSYLIKKQFDILAHKKAILAQEERIEKTINTIESI